MTNKYTLKILMAKAVNYFLNEWDDIEAIADYGDVSCDNNLVERTNRDISLSGHNSLFFGSHACAGRGCIFCSLACSCSLRRINFFEYLTDVLNRAVAMPNGARWMHIGISSRTVENHRRTSKNSEAGPKHCFVHISATPLRRRLPSRR